MDAFYKISCCGRLLLQTYTEMAPMPQPRTRFATSLLNNQIWVVGGYDSVNGDSGVLTAGIFILHIPE